MTKKSTRIQAITEAKRVVITDLVQPAEVYKTLLVVRRRGLKNLTLLKLGNDLNKWSLASPIEEHQKPSLLNATKTLIFWGDVRESRTPYLTGH
ncbi:hypothetical protein AOLI_G00005080 [Acnodon oligacanthus]